MVAAPAHQIRRAQLRKVVDVTVDPLLFARQRCPPLHPVSHGRLGQMLRARALLLGPVSSGAACANPLKPELLGLVGLGVGHAFVTT